MPQMREPGSAFTGEQLQYLREMAAVIRTIPQFSTFTQATPNGVLYGVTGDRATYLGSTSTLSREWVNANDPGVTSNVSWVQLGITP